MMRYSLVLLTLAVGCGEPGFEPGTTCGIAVDVSGAMETSVGARHATACATTLSFETDFTAIFIPLGHELEAIELRVEEVARGETGAAFPTVVDVRAADERRWTTTACTAAIDRHDYDEPAEFGGDHYRVQGAVTCDEPAVNDGAPPVAIDALEFIVTITWSE